MNMSDLEKRVTELEAKGKTAWGRLSDKTKMLTMNVLVGLVVYLLVKTHIL